jgi:hypothetical protein
MKFRSHIALYVTFARKTFIPLTEDGNMSSDTLDRLLLARSSSKLVDTKPTPELEIITFFTKFGYISTIRNATMPPNKSK